MINCNLKSMSAMQIEAVRKIAAVLPGFRGQRSHSALADSHKVTEERRCRDAPRALSLFLSVMLLMLSWLPLPR